MDIEPCRLLRQGARAGQLLGHGRWNEIAEDRWLLQSRVVPFSDLHGEKPLMDHAAEAVYHPCSVKINTSREIVLQRVKTGPLSEGLAGEAQRMPPHSLEERVAGCYPFQIVLFGCLAIRRAPGIAYR
jgi:hypothetical protein